MEAHRAEVASKGRIAAQDERLSIIAAKLKAVRDELSENLYFFVSPLFASSYLHYVTSYLLLPPRYGSIGEGSPAGMGIQRVVCAAVRSKHP